MPPPCASFIHRFAPLLSFILNPPTCRNCLSTACTALFHPALLCCCTCPSMAGSSHPPRLSYRVASAQPSCRVPWPASLAASPLLMLRVTALLAILYVSEGHAQKRKLVQEKMWYRVIRRGAGSGSQNSSRTGEQGMARTQRAQQVRSQPGRSAASGEQARVDGIAA